MTGREDLLDMSRITSGKMRLDVQPVEPLTFIEVAVETVRPAAEARGSKLSKLLDPAAGPVIHVSKPVEPAEPVATVASVVGRTGEPSAQQPTRLARRDA